MIPIICIYKDDCFLHKTPPELVKRSLAFPVNRSYQGLEYNL